MPQLVIELTEAEHDLMTKKADKHDLEQIAKIALDNHFQVHRYTDVNTVPLDLSGRRKAIAALEAERIDLNKPVAPDRYERRLDNNHLRFETDEDFEKAMAAHQWRLDRYNAEKAAFARKRSTGVVNEFGGRSWVN